MRLKIFIPAVENIPPTVDIVEPSLGQPFTEGTNLYVKANAFDSHGTIDSMQFYINGQFVREENNSPKERGKVTPNNLLPENFSAGTYEREAIVTDNKGEEPVPRTPSLLWLTPNRFNMFLNI